MEQATPRDAWRQWESDQAAAIIDSINRVREARGVTLRRMAELLTEFGWPIGFGTLAGILSEKKRAGFTVAEVYAFARALAVPPGYLMLGLPAGGTPGAPVLPRVLTPGETLAWMTGESDIDEWFWTQANRAPDLIRESAVQALRDGIGLTEMVLAAAQQNELLLAARSFKPGELEAVFAADILDGTLLRTHLVSMREWIERNRAEADVLRPVLPSVPAPFDIVNDPSVDLDLVELPLAPLEERDLSGVVTILRQSVERYRSVSARGEAVKRA